MAQYYSEQSFFGRTGFHPLFIVVFGLSLSISVISASEGLVSYLVEPVLGISGAAYENSLKSQNIPSNHIAFFLFRLSLVQLLGFGLVGWLLAQSAGSFQREFLIAKPISWKTLGLAALIMICFLPGYQVFMIPEDINLGDAESEKALKEIESYTENLIKQAMQQSLLLNVFTFGILPAVCEEFFFRGFLFQTIRRIAPTWAALLFSGLIFSLLHFQIYGFFVRWLMGMLLGFIFLYGGGIYGAILAHFINNFATVVVMWMAFQGLVPSEMSSSNYRLGAHWEILSLCLTAILLVFYYKRYHHAQNRQEEPS